MSAPNYREGSGSYSCDECGFSPGDYQCHLHGMPTTPKKVCDDHAQQGTEKFRRLLAAKQGSGGGSSGGCFPAGTLVRTPIGDVPIEALNSGDLIESIVVGSGEVSTRKILKKQIHGERRIWRIEFSNGDSINTTQIHSFFDGSKWKRAGEIVEGDSLVGSHSERRVVVRSFMTERLEPVYNLIVEGDFTFFAAGAVVHCFSYFRQFRIAAWSLVAWLAHLRAPNSKQNKGLQATA